MCICIYFAWRAYGDFWIHEFVFPPIWDILAVISSNVFLPHSLSPLLLRGHLCACDSRPVIAVPRIAEALFAVPSISLFFVSDPFCVCLLSCSPTFLSVASHLLASRPSAVLSMSGYYPVPLGSFNFLKNLFPGFIVVTCGPVGVSLPLQEGDTRESYS